MSRREYGPEMPEDRMSSVATPLSGLSDWSPSEAPGTQI